MRKFLSAKNILTGGMIVLMMGVFYIFFTDEYSQAKFRVMQDKILSTEKVDLTGLRELQASGGPIIDFPDLKRKLRHIKQRIVIIDGLTQYHGYICNNYFKEIPTTFFGYEHNDSDVRHFVRRLIFTGTTQIRPDLITPEVEMAKKYGFEYKNIKINSKIDTSDEATDDFVAFVDDLPQNIWVHFHCRLGKGRTSMMLVMFDIMKNAPKVTLQDIIKRQFLLGSQNLFNTTSRKNGTYTSKALSRRKKFIEDFYAFICQRKAGGIQRWSDWHHQRYRAKKLSP